MNEDIKPYMLTKEGKLDPKYKYVNYTSKREVIDSPHLLTQNEIINRQLDKRGDLYYLQLPRDLLNKLGIRVSSSQFDLKVILVRQ